MRTSSGCSGSISEVLRDYARREIRILDRRGRCIRERWKWTTCWTRSWSWPGSGMPDRGQQGLTLDLWLTELIQEALEQWIKQEHRSHVSLEARADEVLPDEVPQEDEEDWWADLLGDEETLNLEDLIPGSDGTEIWDKLEAEEQQNRLLSLLAQLRATQRQAFLLHAGEGYTADEIAMLQDRPESDVKADIEAARKWLRDGLGRR